MSEAIRNAVHTTIARVLEDWGMMLVDPEAHPDSYYHAEEPFYVASIRFHGVVDGQYSLLCQRPFAYQLAENLLGLDTDETVNFEQVQDALKEMINVISGNLLTETYGEDTVFALTPPEAHRAQPEEVKLFESPRTFNYLADSEALQVLFVLELPNAN